jgi:drug/metabolite transporter (DMT)-like permease
VGGTAALGVAFALGSTVIAAIGNLVTVRLQSDQVPTMSGTAWGMSYGALTATVIASIGGSAWTFEWGFAYVSSLVYLSVFGSIVAFVTYFKLLKLVGANRASFTAVAIPVVAMALSTLFEGYRWTSTAAFGAALAFAGNYLALSAKR